MTGGFRLPPASFLMIGKYTKPSLRLSATLIFSVQVCVGAWLGWGCGGGASDVGQVFLVCVLFLPPS